MSQYARLKTSDIFIMLIKMASSCYVILHRIQELLEVIFNKNVVFKGSPLCGKDMSKI